MPARRTQSHCYRWWSNGSRALPLLSRKVFDYTCLGDIEELCEVIAEALGSEYVAEMMMPRYDLAYWLNRIGYVETTRYCNSAARFVR